MYQMIYRILVRWKVLIMMIFYIILSIQYWKNLLRQMNFLQQKVIKNANHFVSVVFLIFGTML